MSTPREEARALDDAWRFLLDLCSGEEKRIPSATRDRARWVVRHYPLAAGERWLMCNPSWSSTHAATTMSDTEGVEFVKALVGAWDCCGTCAGGVLLQHDRAVAAKALTTARKEDA